jgi:hypothetical protein
MSASVPKLNTSRSNVKSESLDRSKEWCAKGSSPMIGVHRDGPLFRQRRGCIVTDFDDFEEVGKLTALRCQC